MHGTHEFIIEFRTSLLKVKILVHTEKPSKLQYVTMQTIVYNMRLCIFPFARMYVQH